MTPDSTSPPPAPDLCPNCGQALLVSYCAGCGQARPAPLDYSLRALAESVFEELTSYDGRVWGTLRRVYLEPGALAQDHFAGRRASHLSPFRLFVVANVAAWLVLPVLNVRGFDLAWAFRAVVFPGFWQRALEVRAALAGASVEQFSERIRALGAAEDTVAVLAMVPLFALGVRAVLAGRGFRYVQALVFAAHFYCLHLLAVLLALGLAFGVVYPALVAHPEWPASAWSIPLLRSLWFQHALAVPLVFPWLLRGLRRAFGLAEWAAAWRSVALTAWAVVLARSFFDLAFFLVLLFA